MWKTVGLGKSAPSADPDMLGGRFYSPVPRQAALRR
jgi:hypothetical protein